MSSRNGKPFYPARWFHRRHEYPARQCAHCGRRMAPRIYIDRGYLALESARVWAQRRYCDRVCARRITYVSSPGAERSEPLSAAKRLLAQALRNHDPDLLHVWPEVRL